MSRVIIYPYKMSSRSAHKLQEFLEEAGADSLLVYPDREYRPRATDLIIGWGSGDWPNWRHDAVDVGAIWLNKSDAISNSVNKTDTFRYLNAAHISCPENTTSYNAALGWLQQGSVVIARQETEGRDGSGLVIIRRPDDMVSANLYTKYKEKTEEFRVHVFQGRTFWGQIRTPITDDNSKYYQANPHPMVRTSSNGWTLYVCNEEMPEICKAMAERAVQAIGLDFGCVDIGWLQGTSYSPESVQVYETNTSPEISDRTCRAYVEQILRLV